MLCLPLSSEYCRWDKGSGTRGQVRCPDIGMQWDEGSASLSHFGCLLAEDDGLLAVRGSLQADVSRLLAVRLG